MTERPGVLVCIRVADARRVAPGSVEVACADCGAAIWRGDWLRSTGLGEGGALERIDLPADAVALCAQCALLAALEAKDADAIRVIRSMLGW